MYDAKRDVVQHVTPYTTWYMPVDDVRSGHIDLCHVTSISMQLEGFFYASRSHQHINISQVHTGKVIKSQTLNSVLKKSSSWKTIKKYKSDEA